MGVPKWLVVARNEYRVHTGRIRKIRPYLPYLVVGLLTVYVLLIAPKFVGLFIDEFTALFLSQFAVAMIQIILFTIFVYFIIIPITQTLREVQAGQLEIFLAAPIKPSDVLLGEFLGQMPFYVIFVTVITGLFTAAMSPLGLSPLQITLTIIIFIVTFLSALWIGTVLAAILRTKFAETARGRDIGRALAMIIALPLVALIYGIQFGGLMQALVDPGTEGVVRTFLGLLPSSWGAEVIVGFASNPGNLAADGLGALVRFGGLTTFFVGALWLGAKTANRAYSLEPTSFTASKVKLDGSFYNTVKHLGGGGSFGILLVSLFKDYSRRLENLSNITYIMGVLLLMNIFIPAASGSNDFPMSFIVAQFMFQILVVMVAGDVTVRGKENLFLYRKTPSGVGRFVKAMYLKSWLLAAPITVAVTTLMTIFTPQITIISFSINIGLMLLVVTASIAFVLGLFLLNPAFSEKSVKIWLNIIIVIFTSIGLFVVSILVLTRWGLLFQTSRSMLYLQMLQTTLVWLLGIVFLYLGKRKLNRIE